MLSPCQCAPSRISVFTAPARCARALVRSPHSAKASSFSGRVTLAPSTPLAARREAKSAWPASIATYSSAIPACRANAAWMRGDCECATGDPNTA